MVQYVLQCDSLYASMSYASRVQIPDGAYHAGQVKRK